MRRLAKKLLLGLVILLAPSAVSAVTLGYYSQPLPDGIASGWTYPAGVPSLLGEAIMVAENAVYSLHYSPSERDSLALLDGYQQPVRVFSGDVDGDSMADLIVAFSQNQSVRLIVGQEGNKRVTDILTGNLPIVAAGTARINADTLPDLVLADSDSISIFTRINPDSADGLQFSLFARLNVSEAASGHPLISPTMLFGDYNGDILIDLVYNGYVYLNRGNGRFYSQQLPVPQGVKVRLLEVTGDIDGDRRGELLWTSASSSTQPVTVIVADYNSASIFKRSSVLEPGLQDITKSFLYDADGDGHLELAFYSASSRLAVEFPGTANGVSATGRRELFSLHRNMGQLLGPYGTDESSEAGWLFINTAGDSLHVGYAKRPYTDATVQAGLSDTMAVAGVAVAVGDYNLDGLIDVYVVNADGPNLLYRGGRDGKFTEVAAQAGVAQGNDGVSCAWSDYNNDGFPDLFVAGLFLPDKLFFNRGDGTFADTSQILNYNRGSQRATSVSWGDVNRDRYPDLLITSFDGANKLLINRGGRYFDESPSALGPTDSYYHTENGSLVDVDRDGWLDILLLNSDGPARLLLGGAGGQWKDVTGSSGLNSAAQYPKFGQSQSWGDFNGDGYPDLFITRAQDNSELLINNGAGALTRFSSVFQGKPGGGTFGRLGSAIDDFDSDGLTDLLITRTELFSTNPEIPRNMVYLGQTQGYPSLDAVESTDSNSPGNTLVDPLRFNKPTSLPVSGDFDGDGDIDVLYVNYLPDNPNNLFHGSALPLLLMSNASSHSKSVTIILRRKDKKNISGTSVVLFRAGRAYWKTVSGGSGRIQTGPHLTFSLGSAASADSIRIYWPDNVSQKIVGPLFPGPLEVEVDLTAPQLEITTWPGGLVDGGKVISSPLPLEGVLKVTDNSQLSRVLVIVRNPFTAVEDTLRLADRISGGQVRFSFAPPAPGDSLYYYCVATDIYNNNSRLPAAQNIYFPLIAEIGVLKGDIDGNLKVDIDDLLRLLSLIGGKGATPTERELNAGDFNLNGRLDILDLTSLLTLLKQPNPETNVQSMFD